MQTGKRSDKIGGGRRHSQSTALESLFEEQIHVALLASLVPQSVTLDDFVAFNDEIAALARAGVPLGKGLLDLGDDLPGRLGRLCTEVGRRLEHGETLEQVVARSPELFPRAYRAVIESGIKVGRLPAALEGIAHTARRTAQMQRTLGLAMLYPLLLLVASFALLCFWILKLAPVMGQAMVDISPETRPFWNAVAGAAEHFWWWGPALPLLALTRLVWQWRRSRHVARGVDFRPLLPFGVVWRHWKLRQSASLAAMTDMLALLTDYGVPLPRAVALAGSASGSVRLQAVSHDLADRLARGEPASAAAGYPSLVAWVLAGANTAANLPASLRRLRDVYHDEAQRHSLWLTTFVPVVMTGLIGGLTVAVVAAVYFAPFVIIVHQLAEAALEAS